MATNTVEPEAGTVTTQSARVAPVRMTDGGLYRTVGQSSSDNEYVTPDPAEVAGEIANPTVVNVLCNSASAESNTSSDGTTPERASKGDKKDTDGKDADGNAEDESATETEIADETAEISYTERTESEAEDENTSDSDSTMSETAAEETIGAVTDEAVTETVRIDPAIRTLAEHRASNEGKPTESFVESAVRTYLAEALRGNEPWSETAGVTERELSIDADPALEKLIETTAANDDASDAESFVVRTLCEAIDLDVKDRELPVGALEEMDELLVATTENDSSPHEMKDEVVQAALERRVL